MDEEKELKLECMKGIKSYRQSTIKNFYSKPKSIAPTKTIVSLKSDVMAPPCPSPMSCRWGEGRSHDVRFESYNSLRRSDRFTRVDRSYCHCLSHTRCLFQCGVYYSRLSWFRLCCTARRAASSLQNNTTGKKLDHNFRYGASVPGPSARIGIIISGNWRHLPKRPTPFSSETISSELGIPKAIIKSALTVHRRCVDPG